MQRDLEFAAMSAEVLNRLEDNLKRELGDGRGRSYVERQSIALAYVRVLVERLIRQEESRLGLRSD